MGKTTIEWTATITADGTVLPGFSFNPWWGCTIWSAGCSNCYALTLSKRWGYDIWGPKAQRRFFGDKHWAEPLKWQREAEVSGIRRKVFCASMADVFERHMLPDIDARMDAARYRLWHLIDQTPMLDWLLLTKRPEHIRDMLPVAWLAAPRPNVWLGTSVEDQAAAEARIPWLLRVPAVVRFLSCEPLLGPVDLSRAYPCGYYCDEDVGHVDHAFWTPGRTSDIHWLIAGGESGRGARPMHPDWARSLRDQCQAAGVAFHFKQWGEARPYSPLDHLVNKADPVAIGPQGERITAYRYWGNEERFPGYVVMKRVGKKAAGRELDGRTWDQFPEAMAVTR